MTLPTSDADEILSCPRDDLGFRVRSTQIPVDAKDWFNALHEVRELRAEVAHLREQRDDLQRRGTELVEENRALKAWVATPRAAGPQLQILRLSATAKLPAYAKPGDSGLDLSADNTLPVTIPPGERRFFKTGVAVALPAGYEGQVRPRSGLARDYGIATFLGTIDQGYRGDIGVTLQNHSDKPFVVEPGMRIGQLVVCPVAQCEVVEVSSLDETERGGTGFGSSGLGPKEAA